MLEEMKESKAKKLAAARKKLKEYQKRGSTDNALSGNSQSGSTYEPQSSSSFQAGGSSVSSNISEASDTEFHTYEREVHTPNAHNDASSSAVVALDNGSMAQITVQSYFSEETPGPSPPSAQIAVENIVHTMPADPESKHESVSSVNAIQVLIEEKATLTSELNKYKCMCREKDLELEELRFQFTSNSQRLEELQQRFVGQQAVMEQLRSTNAELQHKLAQANANAEDQVSHLDELKRLLTTMQERAVDVEQQFKEKSGELEMAQLRIRQLSDESNVHQDNRVESLTQTQFMYEQQIRDLQAMVQQLTHDKDQANNQYQNYAQHLNAEIDGLNEKNSELMDECVKLQERERQLVEHISGLEKEIQKNISRKDQLKAEKEQESDITTQQYIKEIGELKSKINNFDFERHEFQLKIKSQEIRLEGLNRDLEEKQLEIEKQQEYLQNVNSEKPDQTKLLATMESDKIAASRALAQNVELKRQLDELELRFVQLTNDKADLMNRLDAEEHANREMRTNYTEMEERIKNSDERFKFKDEEMIRLSRENANLSHQVLVLQQQVDRLKYYEAKGQHLQQVETASTSSLEENEKLHNHDHNHEGSVDQHNHDDIHDSCDEKHAHTEESYHDHNGCEPAQEAVAEVDTVRKEYQHQSYAPSATSTEHIPTSEAVEKLHHRFTQLMSQVADLTEEKQRLEHLVLQLQSETETIGEYITLYQTQRRILKQREYEKAAQMQLLKEEREKMRDKIAMLNNLVASLSSELPHNAKLHEQLNAALVDGPSSSYDESSNAKAEADLNRSASHEEMSMAKEMAMNDKLNSAESQQILSKIQDIITEIKETTKEMPVVQSQAADHLKCCLGKFEVV